MKCLNKITIYSLLLCCITLASCKKFLNEYSQDEIRPTTTADLTSLMFSDAYPYQVNIDNFDMLTDDIQTNGVAKGYDGNPIATYATALSNATAMFKFDPTMFDASQTIPAGAYAYTIYYSKIKGCNVVMDQLSKVTGTQTDKDAILGQCLFLRAYYYLKLVTLYGQPYSGSGINPAVSLGVPLVLSSTVKDGGVARNTLKEVYDQVEADLLKAAPLLEANFVPTTNFRVGATAAYALLSRFYLYRGLTTDWDKVISNATKGIQQRSTLSQLSAYFNSFGSLENAGIYNAVSPEVIWVYGSNPQSDYTYFPQLETSTAAPPLTASQSLSDMYDKGDGQNYLGDLRYKAYFTTYINGSAFIYCTGKFTNYAVYGTKGFRVAELYLNRAEALIRRALQNGAGADITAALADLNLLRESRYDNRQTAYTPINITDGAALFKFCQDERRRELCLEDGFRWVDIKRWGLAVSHTYIATDGATSTHVLAAGSLLYALPIPYTAITNNPALKQNPR